MRWLRLFLLFASSACLSAAATFTWSGAAGDHNYSNPANWAQGVVPPNNGTATLIFGNAPDTTVALPFVLDVAQVQFQNTPGQNYSFDASFFAFLVIENGLTTSGGGTQSLGPNIAVSFSGTQNINVVAGTLEIQGGLIGTGDLVKKGAGKLRLDGVSLFSGGVSVDSGALVFANSYAVPSGSVTTSASGYVGAENATALKYLLGQVDGGHFYGSIGLDTAPGAATPSVYSDQIDVSAMSNYAGIGSTSSARLIGNFRVASNQDYRFSGGAGILYVQANLTNNGSGLQIHSTSGSPLTVVLQGSNNFGGATSVLNSVLVLDSQQAVFAGKILNIDGPGYVGTTERFTTSNSGFLSLLHAASPNAIAGFDSTDLNNPRTISTPIDLSVGGTRTDPYYLGTSTKVTLTGAITPTVGDALYLTAVKGGQLVVGSTLGVNLPGLVVGQSNSFDPQGGTVELTGNNTYSGGTKILGGTLRASSNSALGSGAVAVGSGGTLDVNSGTTISNNISLASGSRLSGTGTVSTAGGITFGAGTILSPGGSAHVGTLSFTTPVTLGPGSIYEFNLKDPTAGPGNGWDLTSVYNFVNLTATSSSPITVNLISLSLAGTPGLVSGFDASQSYTWLFLTGGITGYSPDKFAFNTTNFANGLDGGSFSIAQGNAGLSITFTPVPEPGTFVLFGLGLVMVALVEYRRRSR